MSMIKDFIAERLGYFEAVGYLDRGWAVLPLQYRTKKPHFDLAPRGLNSATTDLATVEAWYRKPRDLNIGIAAAASGLVILDIDRRTLTDEGEDLWRSMPDTYTVETSDGWHLYYLDGGRSYAGLLAGGVEVKHRGYVAAPPSVHPDGTRYTVHLDIDPVPFPVHLAPKGKVR